MATGVTPSTWNFIHTAPQDETEILIGWWRPRYEKAFNGEMQRVRKGYWKVALARFSGLMDGVLVFTDGRVNYTPEFWMHKPEAPLEGSV